MLVLLLWIGGLTDKICGEALLFLPPFVLACFMCVVCVCLCPYGVPLCRLPCFTSSRSELPPLPLPLLLSGHRKKRTKQRRSRQQQEGAFSSLLFIVPPTSPHAIHTRYCVLCTSKTLLGWGGGWWWGRLPPPPLPLILLAGNKSLNKTPRGKLSFPFLTLH